MIGWLILILLFAGAVAALRLTGLRGSMLQLGAAALLFGCAGYALQGRPGLEGSPRAARGQGAPIPLTKLRHAFYGNFTPLEHWLLLSEALASRGNTAEAAGALKAAVKQHPNDPQLWIGLGNALVDHSGSLTPASAFAYRRAAELAPDHPGAPFFFGLALFRSGDARAAVAIWQELLADAPADASWRPMVEDTIAVVRKPAVRRP